MMRVKGIYADSRVLERIAEKDLRERFYRNFEGNLKRGEYQAVRRCPVIPMETRRFYEDKYLPIQSYSAFLWTKTSVRLLYEHSWCGAYIVHFCRNCGDDLAPGRVYCSNDCRHGLKYLKWRNNGRCYDCGKELQSITDWRPITKWPPPTKKSEYPLTNVVEFVKDERFRHYNYGFKTYEMADPIDKFDTVNRCSYCHARVMYQQQWEYVEECHPEVKGEIVSEMKEGIPLSELIGRIRKCTECGKATLNFWPTVCSRECRRSHNMRKKMNKPRIKVRPRAFKKAVLNASKRLQKDS